MFCATCRLEYPDHLNFCRSCGQALVRTLGEQVMASSCCTRCGARIVSGEKFCQHCGIKAGVATQETVIGTCHHCNTYWRNSWLFCKSCGLDRDHALQAVSNATSPSPPSVVTPKAVPCAYCTATVAPYSLFCENCGMRLPNEHKPVIDFAPLSAKTEPNLEAVEEIPLAEGKVLPITRAAVPPNSAQQPAQPTMTDNAAGMSNPAKTNDDLADQPPQVIARQRIDDWRNKEKQRSEQQPEITRRETIAFPPPAPTGATLKEASPLNQAAGKWFTDRLSESGKKTTNDLAPTATAQENPAVTANQAPAFRAAASTGSQNNLTEAVAPSQFSEDVSSVYPDALLTYDDDLPAMPPPNTSSKVRPAEPRRTSGASISTKDLNPSLSARRTNPPAEVSAQSSAAPPTSASLNQPKYAAELTDNSEDEQRQIWPYIGLVLGVLLVSFVISAWWNWRSSTTEQTAQTNADETKSQSAGKVNAPLPAANQTVLPANSVTLDSMVLINGGSFMMGRSDADPAEAPVHPVQLKPYYLDRTEVTNQQYLAFVLAKNFTPPSHWINGKPTANELNFPVVNVSWYDAQAYAQWAGKRLPTEEEWEFAARGSDGRIYPWGKTWQPEFTNTIERGSGKIIEVGRFRGGASPFGLLDMCGNVWEWTASEFRSYATNETLEPGTRVIRGGAFDVTSEYATASYRGHVLASKSYEKTGFRCARDAR